MYPLPRGAQSKFNYFFEARYLIYTIIKINISEVFYNCTDYWGGGGAIAPSAPGSYAYGSQKLLQVKVHADYPYVHGLFPSSLLPLCDSLYLFFSNHEHHSHSIDT